MTNQEMLAILKGNQAGKFQLFNELTAKVQSGEPMNDSEVPVFEALKKELFKPASIIVQVEAGLTGSSGAGVS
jgi:hypothetical protein